MGYNTQAIEFARTQNDDDLWDSLINWAIGSASTTGDLLDHVGGHVDPLRVISRIPKGMEIWNLRNRLCHIISDYRTQTSLQEGCNNILLADCVHLSTRLFREVRHCVRNVYITENGSESTSWVHYNGITGETTPSTEPSVEFVPPNGGSDDPSGSERVEEREPFKLGLQVEDHSTNVDYTESMRFKIPRRQPSIDYSREPLPSLVDWERP